MNTRVLYVGGLSDATSDPQLRDLFGAYGTVSRAYIVRHKHSGKSAGYGFVEMGSGEQALSAVVAPWKVCCSEAIACDSTSRPMHPFTPEVCPAGQEGTHQ